MKMHGGERERESCKQLNLGYWATTQNMNSNDQQFQAQSLLNRWRVFNCAGSDLDLPAKLAVVWIAIPFAPSTSQLDLSIQDVCLG